MIKIAHRGNINGKIEGRENSPDYLLEAILQGYDVEVDLWFVEDKPFFGHDKPQYEVSQGDFIKIASNAWFHCKNIEAMEFLAPFGERLRYFWHQEDDYALVSNGMIWTHQGRQTRPTSVLVDLELTNTFGYGDIHGVCTDYPGRIDS
jgi:hypothetical protein